MPTVMITGANRGIGFELARRYAADGWRVLATCRDPAKADALKALAGDVHIHALDVTDFARVDALAGELGDEAIDVLINNAGVSDMPMERADGVDYDRWAEVLRVNTMAPHKVSDAFAGHVAKSETRIIVAISSRLGSIEMNSGGDYAYCSSKAALNLIMKGLSGDLHPRGITVAVLHPGWVRTDMGGQGAAIDVDESGAGLHAVISGLGPADSGRFFNYDGSELPW